MSIPTPRGPRAACVACTPARTFWLALTATVLGIVLAPVAILVAVTR